MSDLKNHKWKDYEWMKSPHPTSDEKWIYLVAGERNTAYANQNNGLWGNIGETSKTVSDRLDGLDYKRKAAGGTWVILNQWKVPSWISDKDIHGILKQNTKVVWKESDNTEEFFFMGDSGNGEVASSSIESAIRESMIVNSGEIIAGIKVERAYLRKKLVENEISIAKKQSEDNKNNNQAIAASRLHGDIISIGRNNQKSSDKRADYFPTIRESVGMLFSSMLMSLVLFGLYRLVDPSFAQLIFIYFPICSVFNLVIEVLWIRKLLRKAAIS